MKRFLKDWGMVGWSALAGIIVMFGLVQCSDVEGPGATSGGTYKQVERLGRPGINEALVVTPAFMAAFNSIGPSFDLTAAASPVVTEAAAVLRAVYLGVCYISGAVLVPNIGAQFGVPATALKPGGVECKDDTNASILGNAMYTGGVPANGLTAKAKAAGDAYALKMAGYFLPDVLRVDTTITSGYFSAPALCNGLADGSPLLCGGRLPDDDTIDVTYGFLFNGDPTGSPAALYDGVSYDGEPGNTAQGHDPVDVVAGTFPYIPAPY